MTVCFAIFYCWPDGVLVTAEKPFDRRPFGALDKPDVPPGTLAQGRVP